MKMIKYVLILFLYLSSSLVLASDSLNPRIQIGLNLFPAVIAANTAFSNSEIDAINIVIIYSQHKKRARKAAHKINALKKIRGHSLNATFVHMDDFFSLSLSKNTALFLIDKIGAELPTLINFSTLQEVILFSPFKGDVKKGVLSGFQVSNKVLPEINLNSMRKSNIQLKQFFLRIAVKHGQ